MKILVKFVIFLLSSTLVSCLTIPFLDRFSNFECFMIGAFAVAVNALVIDKLNRIVEEEE